MVIRYFLISTFFLVTTNYAIEVKDFFHHKAAIGEQKGKSIELGTIVFYFDKYPSITNAITKQGDLTKHTFFMPDVTLISKKAEDIVKKLNQSKDLPYTVTIELKKQPTPGMEIILSYSDIMVGVSEPRSFDAISLHPAVAIHLYDKQLIKKIGKESKPIIELAHAKSPKVIIDCGHGGQDFGAIATNSLKEKDVTLAIGDELSKILKNSAIAIAMTRDSDTTVRLDERTSYANSLNGTLFISIHANASLKKETVGIETYCINNNLFKDKSLITFNSDAISFSRFLDNKYKKSAQFASLVHRNLIEGMYSYQVTDRNVRYSVGQVLLGTTMPAILVEVGYLSHEKEADLLAQRSYQLHIAQGIAQGIKSFLAILVL